ncbi:MAG: hypothetical protein A2104_05740 [Candidatus Melainabacteria bacterium GWF2_32_7]|nr:MAG: hypothetical protein A2104_05740 [Candidatus Melainabacteria bacterium GWF2_32_7]
MTTISTIHGPREISPVMSNQAGLILLDNTKGSLGNKMDCLGSQIKNDVYTSAQAGMVGATAAGATIAASRCAPVGKVFTAIDGLIKSGLNHQVITQAKEFVKPALNFVKSAPVCVKIAASLALISITATSLVRRGQIDQKYTDRASAQKALAS